MYDKALDFNYEVSRLSYKHDIVGPHEVCVVMMGIEVFCYNFFRS